MKASENHPTRKAPDEGSKASGFFVGGVKALTFVRVMGIYSESG